MAPRVKKSITTKCWTCSRVIPKTCPWALNFEPVRGWKAHKNEHEDGTWSYAVEECPLYEDDRPIEAPDVFIAPGGKVSYWCKRCGMQVYPGVVMCYGCKSQYFDWDEAYSKRRRLIGR